MNVRISGGVLRGRRLHPVKGVNLRPTSGKVRLAVFSVLAREISEWHRILDLYAGTGVMGIEALSRGADWVDFVEMDYRLARRIRENLQEFSFVGMGHVYTAKVETTLNNFPKFVAIYFARPIKAVFVDE